ncbi:hypothetical protein ACTJIL_09480 [Luteimonas sp. 22616]|uniref:hypothetical protein n=1 Tax=Luteimonas sp. 22616 TaxID=3453951 RepID=UPI003F85908D
MAPTPTPHLPRLPAAQHGIVVRPACVLLLLAALSGIAHAREPAWRTVSTRDGLLLETRPVAGERFDELRVSTTLVASPDAVADYLFGKYLDAENRNIRRTFIKRDPAVTVWSDILDTPVISERCYSMRFEREALAAGGVRVAFTSLAYAGKEPMPGCIALRARGEWRMTPTATGTRLSYTSLTDLGGRVPALLARRSLSAAAVSSVSKVAAGVSGLPLPRGIGD